MVHLRVPHNRAFPKRKLALALLLHRRKPIPGGSPAHLGEINLQQAYLMQEAQVSLPRGNGPLPRFLRLSSSPKARPPITFLSREMLL